MLDLFSISPTRWLGLLSFGVAAVACGRAARRRPSPWRALAVAQALLFVEIVFGGRHRLHAVADAFLTSGGRYGHREALQLALLAVLALSVVTGAVALAGRVERFGAAAAGAIAATGVAGVSMAIEIVSLHATDQWLYARVAGLLVVGIGWALTGAATTICALADARGRQV